MLSRYQAWITPGDLELLLDIEFNGAYYICSHRDRVSNRNCLLKLVTNLIIKRFYIEILLLGPNRPVALC